MCAVPQPATDVLAVEAADRIRRLGSDLSKQYPNRTSVTGYIGKTSES